MEGKVRIPDCELRIAKWEEDVDRINKIHMRREAESRKQKAEGRRQKAESSRQKAVGRRQKAVGRRQ